MSGYNRHGVNLMSERSGARHDTVLVKMEIYCRIELPSGGPQVGLNCDDPAIEAALEGLPQSVKLYQWGKENPPVQMYYEAHEEDCEIEEDDR